MRKHVLKLMMTALLMALVVPCVNAQDSKKDDKKDDKKVRIEIGYILCEGDTVVTPEAYDTLDIVAIGVVFDVDDSNEHGWAVSLEDAGLFTWGGYGEDTDLENYTRRGSAADDLDGKKNTQTILELDDFYPAFSAVDFDNGWYLPAAGQLKRLYKNLKDVNSTLEEMGAELVKPIGVTYWSSTEYSDIDAWYLTTIGGLEYSSDGYNDHKDGYRLVRSIRDF
jgi:hypothetical protein